MGKKGKKSNIKETYYDEAAIERGRPQRITIDRREKRKGPRRERSSPAGSET